VDRTDANKQLTLGEPWNALPEKANNVKGRQSSGMIYRENMASRKICSKAETRLS